MSSRHDQAPSDTGVGNEPGATTREAGRQYVPRPAPHYDDSAGALREPSGAAIGFTMAAAVLMMLSGAWNFLEGLGAILRGSYYVVLPNYTYNLSVSGWGWFHLILGAVVFIAGACLFTDQMWARVAGIAVASISAIVNFLYIPYMPVWSIALIALDVAVIWALLAPRYRWA
jgi:hypothetical protein